MTTKIIKLVKEWDSIAQAKWRELRVIEGHFISKHSPQLTQVCDTEKRERVRVQLMRYAVNWFAERGVKILCSADPRNPDGFQIFEQE